ncbi:MAG: hypothetical protein LBV47_05145 [Bacteroidales bacterium]|jgi:DNA-binding MurR/RpiR family transcriptional regulator|nr:hypothetical protein [Bacteroidales bacterium]
MTKQAFQKGWYRIPYGKVSEARIRLIAALGVTTYQAFRNHLKGEAEHTEEQINAIEEIFKSYGITEIWGTV